jgi:hypothetical protein
VPENDNFILGLLEPEAIYSLSGGTGAPSFPASNEGMEAQFFVSAHKFFQIWLDGHGGPKAGTKPCAIVLSRAIVHDMERLGATRVHYFDSSADAAISGKVLIASHDLAIVAEIPLKNCSTKGALGTALTGLDLQDAVHCVLLGDRGEIILCGGGLNKPTTLVKVQKNSPKLDSILIDKLLWAFHEKFTQTSSGRLMPWKNAKERITMDDAELRTSMMLGVFLGMSVGDDNVTVEDHTSHGRLDVKIHGSAMKSDLGPCAMECKVLRSREVSGTKTKAVAAQRMIDHASEGIQQACNYRKDINGTLAYLCCFDAREVDEDQPEVLAFAATQSVLVRRYFMYSSPADHRKAAMSAKKAGAFLTGEVA